MIFNTKKYKKLKFDFQELKAAYDHSSELYQKVLNENHQLHKTIKFRRHLCRTREFVTLGEDGLPNLWPAPK